MAGLFGNDENSLPANHLSLRHSSLHSNIISDSENCYFRSADRKNWQPENVATDFLKRLKDTKPSPHSINRCAMPIIDLRLSSQSVIGSLGHKQNASGSSVGHSSGTVGWINPLCIAKIRCIAVSRICARQRELLLTVQEAQQRHFHQADQE